MVFPCPNMNLSFPKKITPLKQLLSSRLLAFSSLALVTLSAAVPAFAGGKNPVPVDPAIWQKPAWLTDLSLGVRETYDSNVFLAGADRGFYPLSIPEGDVATKNQSSWVTTISPKLGIDLVPLLGKPDALKLFTLGYAPDCVIFHDTPSETYSSHRFTTAIKGGIAPVTVSLDNAFTYIDGSHQGLLYPGGASSYTNGTVRERRDQWQERTKACVKIDLGTVFIRPTVSLLYYDLATDFQNSSIYTNYVDRYDINGGADLGYNLTKETALTLGYRYGHQYQQTWPFDADQITSTNDYQRVLFGVEGSPVKWLKVEATAGPQFTTYTDNRPFNGGVKANGRVDRNASNVYGEASVTVTPTASDALVFKYKRWNWVSSTGKNVYVDSLYDLSYRHQITKALQLELGARAGQADYNPSAYRDDWDFTPSGGLRYAVTANLSVDASYTHDRGHNEQVVGVPFPSTREFNRNVVSSGVQWKF